MKAFSLILILFSCLLSAEIRHQYTLPNNTDELGQLYINSNQDLNLSTLPKIEGLIWGSPSVSSNTSIINGRRSHSSSVRINFKALKPGDFTIPAFKISGHEVPAIDFKVQASPYDDAYFIKTKIEHEGDSLYPGQFFRLKVDIYLDQQYAIQGDFPIPELTSEGLKFRSFANRSSQNKHIEDYQQTETQFNGKTYHLISFNYVVSALINGEYLVSTDHNLRIIKRSGTPGINRPITLQRQVSFPKIKIKTLPPAPADAINTSLVGDWSLTTEMDKKESKVGIPFTLSFSFKAKDGDPERFNIDQQNFKYFRLLSENREIEDDSLDSLAATKIFVLAALGSDVKLPEMKFAIFDPIKESYRILKAQFPTIKFSGEKFKEVKASPRPIRKNSDEQKHELNILVNTRLPLITNLHPLLFVLASLLPLALFLKTYTHMQLSPRARQKKKLRQIRRLLKKSTPEKAHLIYKEHLMPLLKQIHSLQFGEGNSQVIQLISDAELRKTLTEYENQRFQKDKLQSLNGKKLSRALKALSFLFILAAPLSNQAQTTALKSSEHYIKLLETEPENISATYHAALALDEEKKYVLAYAYTERLSRMAPRLEANQSLKASLAKKLKIKTSETPRFRPDELWTVAIYIWILTFLILCVFRKNSKLLISALLTCSFALALWSYTLSQNYWAKNQYTPITKEAASYTSVNNSLKSGQAQQLSLYTAEAFASQRILLKLGKQSLWIERKDLFKIW
ncbi:hypothetical protein LNTAR_03334 [Lentisphaera araneosa HTCC2155]|uniref:Protein BatD n=1 Tax=Lentisphaera araneosa HTCC2155 TaxID=313628 RepID=A6DT54_9BACT|nr:BatD family protein [Lentisphaera araneosa]EDM25229.1 hypothetical protein LNTAR_03334 [Lentisphaera araneosa HTCC2155]